MENAITPEDIRKRIGQLQLEIRLKQAEIKKIQNICPHQNYSRGIWQTRPGQNFPNVRICNDCGKPIDLFEDTGLIQTIT